MNSMQRAFRLALFALAASALTGPAWTHAGHEGVGSFASGFVHPLNGLDHLSVMLGVGLMAALSGGRLAWLVPSIFMLGMVLGGALAMAGFAIPFVEIGIMGSVVGVGAILVMRKRTPVVALLAMCGAFAVFHGSAHGAEMPAGGHAIAYAAGFLFATAILHGVGILLGLALVRATRIGAVP